MGRKSRSHPWRAPVFRIVLPAALTVLLFAVTVFLIILPSIEEQLLARKREMLRELTRTAYSIVAQAARREQAGELSLEQAQAQAAQAIRALRYGPEGKDYFWVSDMEPRIIVHPYRPDLEGQNVSDYLDLNGKRLFVAFVEAVREEGEGFVDYMWQWKDNPAQVAPKLSYVKVFAPWQWIIGTGIYVEDVHEQVASFTRQMTRIGAIILAFVTTLSAYIIWRGFRTEQYRRRTEHVLLEREERLRNIVENVSGVTYTLNAAGEITFVSPVCCEVMGYEPPELVGRPFSSFVHPDDVVPWRDILNEAFTSRTAQRGVEYRFQNKNGEWRWHRAAGAVVSDTRRAPLYYVGYTEDITENKQAEEAARLHQQQLVQADKMASLGTLVAGVAHEINNPNQFIMMSASLLERAWAGAQPILDEYYTQHGDFVVHGLNYSELRGHVQEYFSGIREGSERIRSIVQELRDFSRQQPVGIIGPVNCNEVVRSSVLLLGNMLEEATRRFTVYYADDCPPVIGNFRRLEQVCVNLIQNACQALTSSKQGITISVIGGPQRASVSIVVEDEGVGIPQENLDRLCDPFFTTKRESGGTGLGLCVSARIVQEHGGVIFFSSKPGKGTTATIRIPAGVPVDGCLPESGQMPNRKES